MKNGHTIPLHLLVVKNPFKPVLFSCRFWRSVNPYINIVIAWFFYLNMLCSSLCTELRYHFTENEYSMYFVMHWRTSLPCCPFYRKWICYLLRYHAAILQNINSFKDDLPRRDEIRILIENRKNKVTLYSGIEKL